MEKLKKWFKRNVLKSEITQYKVYIKHTRSNKSNVFYVNMKAKGKVEAKEKTLDVLNKYAYNKNNYSILKIEER
ncbi:hypothetical protein BH792_gp175 [Staphylococcus phage Stau2]|uniref:DUF7644 domain-containing protein n=2 Tax=Silviavirus TaxID=1857889 RepID=A0A0U1ZW15_9CAUD|nr:hypothetical protein F422_gp173 [Staphylococcus phage SA11]YP_009275931.1 hypothetical protein BH792_gp175 [Staphylococcus phage Stau2]APC42878.1 hypothetical protein SAP1_013 [Staphylococcus phage StAP1]QQO38170.1 hypothetical protein LSA2308_00150 [Staphylococcus phage LSA2308]QYC52129.1 hypothetical protein RP15_gp173 [Staphylococcus phage vB_Sau-RP15]UGL60668.1 hypothetical protein [Staphylococcus phage vB_SauM-HM01]USZ62862.1 hypothetical protein LSA2311_orf00054 [Staphylococcus phage